MNSIQPIRRGAQGTAVANLQDSLLRLPPRRQVVSDTGHRALEKASAPAPPDRVLKNRAAKLAALLQKPFARRLSRRMERKYARERGLPQAQ